MILTNINAKVQTIIYLSTTKTSQSDVHIFDKLTVYLKIIHIFVNMIYKYGRLI